MNVTIYPTRFILEKAFLGSKSLTHRFLIASFLINEGIMLREVGVQRPWRGQGVGSNPQAAGLSCPLLRGTPTQTPERG